eukprot:6117537-Amphidinium_carterae.2
MAAQVGGYWGILAMTVYHLVALAFTIGHMHELMSNGHVLSPRVQLLRERGFSFVLLFFVDWEALLSCDSEESCRGVWAT